ncbi:MAG: hypothetical protein ACI9U2_004190 [Bradymonadia bacterium]|jgi:uncharacterized protein (TIGR01244 family)
MHQDVLFDLPHARAPFEGIITAGQPSAEQLRAVAAAGYKLVINTRAFGEPLVDQSQAFVEGLGMRYLHIPMSGAGDLTIANAKIMADALAADDALPALVHCASSNRVGALFALKAFHLEGKSADDALAEGRASGLTGMQAMVRPLLK